MRMTRVRAAIAWGVISACGLAPLAAQQSPRPPVPASPPAASTSQKDASPAPSGQPESAGLLRVDVVVSRFSGDKRLASLPYTLYATIGSGASLRLSQNVPIVTSVGDQKNYNYQELPTKIDFVSSRERSDGRYEYQLNLSTNFFYAVPQSPDAKLPVAPATDRPVFGDYTISNRLISRDGQTLTFSIATDRVTGETIRAEVTVTAVK